MKYTIISCILLLTLAMFSCKTTRQINKVIAPKDTTTIFDNKSAADSIKLVNETLRDFDAYGAGLVAEIGPSAAAPSLLVKRRNLNRVSHSAEFSWSGALYQHYEFGAYGSNRYSSSTTAFPISRRYTAQVADDETGLYYFGTRYYDPNLGRFIQPDTQIAHPFDPQSFDRYAYARNNLWQLYAALAWGAQKLHFICLWNRQAGDGPSGTKHMYDTVVQHSGQVHVLDTTKLW